MKEDRMLTDIELENVAAGEGAPRSVIGVLEYTEKGLNEVFMECRYTSTRALSIRNMIDCCVAIREDYSVKSEKIWRMKEYYNRDVMNSDIPLPYVYKVEFWLNYLIERIGE